MANNPHVFISYSHRDTEAAHKLTKALRACRLDVWIDERLEPARVFSADIAAALRSSTRVVILWSANAAQSEWAKDEAGFACCHAKMVPLSLDGTAPPEPFSKVNALLITDVKTDIKRIIALIKAPIDPAQAHIWSAPELYDEKLKTFHITENLIGRDDELAMLQQAWTSGCALKDETAEQHRPPPEKTNLVVLHAMGGTGKTALIHTFYRRMQDAGWHGAEAAYVWSFYSQGTDEKRQGSADEFFFHALEWFGYDGDITKLSPLSRGLELARLVAKRRALLILDGLEPLQYPSGQGRIMQGALKDPGLWELFRKLARSNRGLCIITTRLAIRELEREGAPTVIMQPLEQLSLIAGVELLRVNGVRGTDGELEQAVTEFGRHAFALTLLAHYLTDEEEGLVGDIRKRDRIPSLIDLSEEEELGGHAKRVMARYRIMFEERIKEQKGQKAHETLAARQLTLLYLLGLFDRPAPIAALKALIEAGVEGLTEPLADLTGRQWNNVLRGLRKQRLVNRTEAGEGETEEALDAHPLVREYFGMELKGKSEEAFKAAHARLFQYYKWADVSNEAYDLANSVPINILLPTFNYYNDNPDLYPLEIAALARRDLNLTEDLRRIIAGTPLDKYESLFPDTLAHMSSLYTAIGHGCEAGLYQEAEELFHTRIHRGSKGYSAYVLGAIGDDLSALARFFEVPYTIAFSGQQMSNITSRQSWVGNLLCYRGRLDEAIQVIWTVQKYCLSTKNWEYASNAARQLSEIYLIQGNIRRAFEYAEASVAHSKNGKDWRFHTYARGTLSNVLHNIGDISRSSELFGRTEIGMRMNAHNRFLGRIEGVHYCDLLISQNRISDVVERSETILRQGPLGLGIEGLYRLVNGRAIAEQGDEKSALIYLNNALELLEESGQLDELPRAYITDAHYHMNLSNFTVANQHLQEAWDIAERSGMRLYMTDCLLEWARLNMAIGKKENLSAAHKCADAAHKLIKETGYGRRWPDWHLISARLALLEGNPDAAKPHLAKAAQYVKEGWKIHEKELRELQGMI